MDILVENNVIMSTAIGGSTVIVNPIYEPRGVFSINASNQVQGSLWGTKDGLHYHAVGNASFILRDKDGATVHTEVAIAPDVNSLYEVTPFSASNINDLTHYTVEITILMDGVTKTSIVGISVDG